MDWRNYGDVSFLSEGGSLVRRANDDATIKEYPSLAHEYEVLTYAPNPEDERVFCAMKYVDTNDYQEQKAEISEMFCDAGEDEMLFAALCAEYEGMTPGIDRTYKQSGMYSCPADFLLTQEEAATWLRELKVPEEWII